MKFKILFLLIPISIILFGCQNTGEQYIEQPTNNGISESINESIEENINTAVIQAIHTDPREEGMVTKLSYYELDFDGDGTKERIELHTAAGRHEDGRMIWDDGQKWLLLIEDGNEFYPLLQQYVQLGEVYFNIWYDDNEIPKITVIINEGANLSFMNYYYDIEQQGYIVEEIYNTSGMWIFDSFPNY